MREAFYTPIPRVVSWLVALLFVPAVILALGMARTEGSVSAVVTAALVALLGVRVAIGTWNQHRPVLWISDDEITWGSVQVFRPRRIALTEVEGVAESSNRRVVLTRRSGPRVKIPLGFVRKSEREAARLAIERAVAARGGGATSTA